MCALAAARVPLRSGGGAWLLCKSLAASIHLEPILLVQGGYEGLCLSTDSSLLQNRGVKRAGLTGASGVRH